MAYGVHKVVSFVSSGLWDGCQWLLTGGKLASGGVLEIFERRVGLEGLSERLCALRTDAVIPETASDGEIRVSAAADTCVSVTQGRAGVRQRT